MSTEKPNITNELLYEVLKKIQTDIAALKMDLSDVKGSILQLREDVHRFEGGMLRIERMDAGTQLRLDRIETRLNISDA